MIQLKDELAVGGFALSLLSQPVAAQFVILSGAVGSRRRTNCGVEGPRVCGRRQLTWGGVFTAIS
jgi:hypothetical protein